MEITSELLFDVLSGQYRISRHGRGMGSASLPLPVFYMRGSQPCRGAVYIVRTQDMPEAVHEPCLFICLGSRPVHVTDRWQGEVFYVLDCDTDILTLFNAVQGIYEKISRWTDQMRELVEKKADIEELVRVSIPLFENRIFVTDYELQMLAYCESVEIAGHKEIRLCQGPDRIPEKNSMSFESVYRHQISLKEPYVYLATVNGRQEESYCINLFLGDAYIGCCSLCEDIRPLRESDYLLFRQFADYVRQALAVQSMLPASRFASLKTVLSELLQCFPVARSSLNRALEFFQKENGLSLPPSGWCCAVIRSANRSKTLPSGYLCETLEHMLPYCTAVPWEGDLAVYCVLLEGEASVASVCEILEPYLRDMNFQAGVSCAFRDIYKAHSYYLQSIAILETGQDLEAGECIYRFEDYILFYMLRHSGGAFEAEMLLSGGLRMLLEQAGNAELRKTLRMYLDNECNASRTAQNMYLHRSTLLSRLEKIKSFVDLDTPKQRLYLRMCLYLYDRFAKKQEPAKNERDTV